MSGIVGLVGLDGSAPVDRELLARMVAFQRLRGPDRTGTWIDGSVGLGHTWLRTTTGARREEQPCSIDGEAWITADARVDGRADLISQLRGKGRAVRRTATDPELIVHAFRAWGEDCVEHLIGDFSFAIWDRGRRRVFCAVDHWGLKPFYYSFVGGVFIFANTLDCIRLHPQVRAEPNEAAIGDFLLFGCYQDRDVTAYADIARLAPGHCLAVDTYGLVRRRYWHLPRPGDVPSTNTSDCVERLESTLQEAVRDRLRSPSASVLMSGGVDSVLVAAAARQVRPAPTGGRLAAVTATYASLFPDSEGEAARRAACALGLPVHLVAGDDFAPCRYAEDDPAPPEPFLEPRWSWHLTFLRTAAAVGRVALTGWDGDALFASSLPALWRQRALAGEWLTLAREMAWHLRSCRRLPPLGIRTRLRRLRQRSPPATLPSWLDPDFVQRARLQERLLASALEPLPESPREPAHRALHVPYWSWVIEPYDAGWTGLHLEVRHPLLDLRVVQFALGLPPIPWCTDKHLLRRVLSRYVPREVWARPKTPLAGEPVFSYIRRLGTWEGDRFEPHPELARWVVRSRVPAVASSADADYLWRHLRPLCLNHWLTRRKVDLGTGRTTQ